MKVITLRNIPADAARLIRDTAREHRLSLNRAVIHLIEQRTGKQAKSKTVYHDLDALAGCWSKAEADAFDKDLAEQRRVDPDLWR